MKIIWTFTLLMIPDVVRSISVKGYSDGEVNITCRYVEKDTQNTKYFCKGKKPEKEKGKWCIELIRTEEKDKWVHSGRFSLYDDTRAAVFTVTFRDLSEQDSGMYQCAVDRTMKKDSYTEVKMNVRKERDKHQTTSSSLSSVKPPLITSPSPVTDTDSSSKRSHTTPANSEATGDSQIVVTSAEDLNYAVVNFQKKAVCPDRVSLRNNQDYSEYAAVNHLTSHSRGCV
ncbi:CMRF35-like molecule 5 isoform X2 [Cyprinus carpio]|uniref:CMRF35-like molecule 5 isoform X2 n=1 Tax=Cyprinus carpio TaxID=7962 RepID=A0A9R0B3W0_CYPCA|nr:CMRF35-like molecule 5 isoform X2 [Cyprinus carpio]